MARACAPTCFASTRRAGLALGLLLHVLIAETPPPNNASYFSCIGVSLLGLEPTSRLTLDLLLMHSSLTWPVVIARYFFFAPDAVTAAATNARTLAVGALLASIGFARWPTDLAVGVTLLLAAVHVSALLSAAPPPPRARPDVQAE